MTLQQMRYVVMIAEKGSFSKAAAALFISQPSLSNSIHSLEQELGVSMFIRTVKGIQVSPDGYAFIDAAKRIIAQSDTILRQYTTQKEKPGVSLSVSSIPIGYAFHAFNKLAHTIESTKYNLSFLDGQSPQVIRDLEQHQSEVGVIDMSSVNHNALTHMLRRGQLEFTSIAIARPHALVRKAHPLAANTSASLAEFSHYPFVFYEMDIQDTTDYINNFILDYHMPQKKFRGKDRSTLVAFLRATDGYAICNGLMDRELYSGLTTILLEDVKDRIEIGYVKHRGLPLSALAQQYIDLLKLEIAIKDTSKCSEP